METSDLIKHPGDRKESRTPAAPRPGTRKARPSDEEMLDLLAKLPIALFEGIVFRFDSANVVAGKQAPQRERAVDLLRLARSRERGAEDLWEKIQKARGK